MPLQICANMCQIVGQNCEGYHGMREPDHSQMGRFYWRVQEPSEEEDGVDWCGLNWEI